MFARTPRQLRLVVGSPRFADRLALADRIRRPDHSPLSPMTRRRQANVEGSGVSQSQETSIQNPLTTLDASRPEDSVVARYLFWVSTSCNTCCRNLSTTQISGIRASR
jgi:hypothetical protein